MGVVGVILSLQVVAFAFLGVELVGVTAGEAENPQKVLPSAINAVVWRILIFYIGALVVIMSLVPWNQLDPKRSPFVMVFERIGIPAAAGIINFVVITAAASSCNSGIFSTGRMLYTLAQFGQAPRFLGKVNAGHVPAVGVTVSAAVMLIGVLLNYVVPEQVFVWVISVATVGALWTWAMILIAHMGYRKAVKAGRAERFPSACRARPSPTGSCWASWSWSPCFSASMTARASLSTSPRFGSPSWRWVTSHTKRAAS